MREVTCPQEIIADPRQTYTQEGRCTIEAAIRSPFTGAEE